MAHSTHMHPNSCLCFQGRMKPHHADGAALSRSAVEGS
jgi:hypothetical protein